MTSNLKFGEAARREFMSAVGQAFKVYANNKLNTLFASEKYCQKVVDFISTYSWYLLSGKFRCFFVDGATEVYCLYSSDKSFDGLVIPLKWRDSFTALIFNVLGFQYEKTYMVRLNATVETYTLFVSLETTRKALAMMGSNVVVKGGKNDALNAFFKRKLEYELKNKIGVGKDLYKALIRMLAEKPEGLYNSNIGIIENGKIEMISADSRHIFVNVDISTSILWFCGDILRMHVNDAVFGTFVKLSAKQKEQFCKQLIG